MSFDGEVSEELVRRTAREIERIVREEGAAGAADLGLQFLVCDCHGRCAIVSPEDVRALASAGADRIGAAPGLGEVGDGLGKLIDHTVLNPDATRSDIETLCAEAARHGFKSVCVNPFWVPLCDRLLGGRDVLVCSVVGFPLGQNRSDTKADEARRAVEDGAGEVDMVINVGALKSGLLGAVEEDIHGVVEAVAGVPVKVILETALLDDEEKIDACRIARRAGAAFVKTSTGFGPGGATAADIALMRRVVGPDMGVKASGGIRDRDRALEMVEMGATRIGASAGVKIVTGQNGSDGTY